MDVCIFKNLQTAKPQLTSLEKIVEMIKTSPLIREYTLRARHYYSIGNTRKGDSIMENLLPAFAPAGILLDGKGRQNLIGLTGLCYILIDEIDEELVETSMAILQENNNVLLATRSLSGKGIHLLVPYTFSRDDSITPIPFTIRTMCRAYRTVLRCTADRYSKVLGFLVDMPLKSPSRPCLISYDSEA